MFKSKCHKLFKHAPFILHNIFKSETKRLCEPLYTLVTLKNRKDYRSTNTLKQAGESSMSKKKWIWIGSIIGLLIVGFTIYILMNQQRTTNQYDDYEDEMIFVQKVEEQKLGESILVTGQVIPEDEQKIFLDEEHGEINEYFVEENQQVSEGDPLFAYSTAEVDAEFSRAVRSRDLINKQLAIEQDEISALEKEIVRIKKLAKEDEEYTVFDVQAMEKEKIQLEMSIEGTKGELTDTQELINQLAAKKEDLTVVSKINGIIVKIDKNLDPTEGGGSSPVIHIISSEPYKVIGTMSEFDTVKIKENQPVIIRPKVFKDREWNGVVESVSHFPEGDGDFDDYGSGNVTMYPFKVAITDDTSDLRQGFHVSLEVNVSENEKALAIPHMSLLVDEEELDYVFILHEGRLEKRIVELGDMSDEFVEVKSGVTKGELVVIMADDRMYDGMEVASYDEVE